MVERIKRKMKESAAAVKHQGRKSAVVVRRQGRRTFSSLLVRNYRLYFVGQSISMAGSWMQAVAQMLLVLQLTRGGGSGSALGILLSLEFLPILLLAPYGGILADRFSKRRLLVILQVVLGLLAGLQGYLVIAGLAQLWMIYVMAIILGVVNAVTMPVQQSFVPELVGPERIANAVNLNSIIMNLSRAVGPALAAVVIARWGLGMGFVLNGVSFLAVIACLLLMRHDELHILPDAGIERGRVREAFIFVRSSPLLWGTLLMTALVGMFTYEFSVSLPLLAKEFAQGAGTAVESGIVAQLMGAMGIGAVVSALFTAGRRGTRLRNLVLAASATAVAVFLASYMRTELTLTVAMLLVGITISLFIAFSNALLQQNSGPQLRGRVMAFWTMAYLGTTVFGAPVIGWLGQSSPRVALQFGALSAAFAAGMGLLALRQMEKKPKLSS